MEYKANKTLADFLISHGFKETTDEEYKRKGKREFSKGRKKRILFNYINIDLVISNSVRYHATSIEETALLKFINCKDWRDFHDPTN